MRGVPFPELSAAPGSVARPSTLSSFALPDVAPSTGLLYPTRRLLPWLPHLPRSLVLESSSIFSSDSPDAIPSAPPPPRGSLPVLTPFFQNPKVRRPTAGIQPQETCPELLSPPRLHSLPAPTVPAAIILQSPVSGATLSSGWTRHRCSTLCPHLCIAVHSVHPFFKKYI